MKMHLLAAVLLSLAPLGAQDLTVLTPDPSRPQTEEMLRAYLRRLAHEALDRRRETYKALKTPGQIAAYQRRLRSAFREQLGPFGERTPLNARTTGERSYPTYRIEKLIYESQPGFFVTALLYLPNTEPPYPAVLLPCGHTANGKSGYQEASILLAKSGLATLCYDPIGQGERKQIRDPEYPSTTEHMILSAAPILLGRNLATDMIWDGIRSIDYLASRPDLDASRIGVTGNSGGGMMTASLRALDDRITAAAPGCFITTTRSK
ncbi:MAG: metalloendopeptidase, partial [bacterium]|nr:metalloendopeptidase [bacterium]